MLDQLLNQQTVASSLLLLVFTLWEAVWKGLALWFSARSKQKYWFVAILLINSIGILPIAYLIIHRKELKLGKYLQRK
jgi:hypothetical protein